MDWLSIVSQSPLALWTGYVHTTRPSRKECELKHKEVDAKNDGLCTKLEELHKDVREIRDILVTHVAKI